MVNNFYISKIFNDYADLLEIEGENRFHVNAYRTAAYNISNLSKSVADMIKEGEDLTKLPGIGKDLAEKIAEIVETGSFPQFEELTSTMPLELVEITNIRGLGPVRTAALYRELGIKSLKQLEKAAKEGRIKSLRGFDAKLEQAIMDGIRQSETRKRRFNISVAQEIAMPLVEYLKECEGVKTVEIAGSYRRGMETVGDLDILVTHKRGSNVMEHFVEYEEVEEVVAKGKTRSSALLRYGIQVDLRAVPQISYGAALCYFTGSKEHNVAVRQLALEKGLKINEYGVFKGDVRVSGKTEKAVYEQLGLPYIEPELRENRGEIEAAKNKKLPKLITVDDIRGDLHSHTNETDGRSTLEEMALAAREKGYEYLAISDHSKRLTVARGLNVERLARQIGEIDRLNEKLDGIVILKSIEVDILEDGSLDLPDKILKRLDMVVCGVHYKFNLSRDKQTERIIRGMNNPYFTILAHPTGRMINIREAYDVDMERIIKGAKDAGCVLELNSQPARLDMADIYCKMAKEMGVMVAISTDAHSVNELDFMRLGVKQARRGWLEADNVINTRSFNDLKKLLSNR